MTTIPLPWAAPPLSLNDRMHWRPKAEKVRQAREAARWAIRAAQPRPTPMAAAEVVLHWRVPNLIRRDLDNLAATLKPVIDALVDEGVLPDDDWRHVTRASSEIHPPDPNRRPSVWVQITSS